jgi:hypothetical protein
VTIAPLALLASATVAVASPVVSVPPTEAPLRAVVYKISILQTNQAHIEQYNTVARPIAEFSDNGTIEIDVMANAETLLGVHVIEIMHSRGYPAEFNGNVGPEDGVHFPEGALSDASITLLRFFGVRFAADQSLEPGSRWTTETGTTYTVKSADGRRITLELLQHIKVANSISTITIQGTVVYDAGLLVPLSGDVTQHRMELHPEGAIELIEALHFARASDSFDQPDEK